MTGPTRAKTKKRPTLKKRIHIVEGRDLLRFPQVKGKKLEGVEFSTMAEDHSITLLFQDQTDLRFDIEPGFTLYTVYSDWKTGNQRPIKRWAPVRSRLFREE